MKGNLILLVLLMCNLSLMANHPVGMTILSEDVIIDKSFKIKNQRNLFFESGAGDVRVYTSDKNEIRLKVYGDPDVIEKVDISYSETTSSIKIKVKKLTGFWEFFSKRFYVDFDLIIPENFNIEINSGIGDIFLKRLTGSIRLKTTGDVKAENISGDVSIQVSAGDVFLKNVNGKLNVKTSGGDIKVENVSGDAVCTTTGGDIRITSYYGKVDAKSTGGDIIIYHYGETTGINAATVGGDIILSLNSNFEGYFSLSTTGGDVRNDFELSDYIHRRSSRIEGYLRKIEPRVECRTTGGDIRVSMIKK